MAKEKEYRMLASTRSWLRMEKLYQGKDHLLLAQAMGYTEDYRRFFYRDIQSILLRPHNRMVVWAVLWAMFFLLFLAFGLPYHFTNFIYFWPFLAFYALGFLINLILGPGCVCHLKTAIQTVQLPILRARQARKIINRLKPLIDSAQADLTGMEAAVAGPTNLQSPEPVAQNVTAILKAFQPQAHWVLYGLMVPLGALEMSRFFGQWLSLYILETILGLAVSLFALIALIRQAQTDIPPVLRRVTLGSFLFLIVDYSVSFFYQIYMGSMHPHEAANQWVNLIIR